MLESQPQLCSRTPAAAFSSPCHNAPHSIPVSMDSSDPYLITYPLVAFPSHQPEQVPTAILRDTIVRQGK